MFSIIKTGIVVVSEVDSTSPEMDSKDKTKVYQIQPVGKVPYWLYQRPQASQHLHSRPEQGIQQVHSRNQVNISGSRLINAGGFNVDHASLRVNATESAARRKSSGYFCEISVG
jgi:hypothetical protein